jgi:hypothetical protein
MTAVYLNPEPARLSEHGKRWLEENIGLWSRFRSTVADITRLAQAEVWEWPRLMRQLELEGVPTAISSGVSQYGMQKLINHINGNASFTEPTVIGLALCTTAPTSTSTGATLVEAGYTGYVETNIVSNLGAATAATPSVATNSTQITGPACTGSTSTLLGFALKDGTTVGSGNVLWYGTLPSTVISTSATPPVIAASSFALSMTGT